MARKKLAARVIRGFFVGSVVGMGGGMGLYLIARALNMVANSTVANPVAMILLCMGFSITAAIGIELSKELEESE